MIRNDQDDLKNIGDDLLKSQVPGTASSKVAGI